MRFGRNTGRQQITDPPPKVRRLCAQRADLNLRVIVHLGALLKANFYPAPPGEWYDRVSII